MGRRISLSLVGFVVLVVLGMVVMAFAADLQQQLSSESAIEQVLKRGALRVGMSTFVPWAMKDKTGKLIGFEIDVAERLAKDIGVKVEFVPTSFAGIIPALLTGKFDLIVTGMGITPERNLKVNYTAPYDTTGMMIYAHKKLAAGFTKVEDFDKPDVTLALRMGGTPVLAAKKFAPKAKMRQFDEQSQVFQELLNGNAHAVFAVPPMGHFMALQYPDTIFEPLKEPFTYEPIGMALRKGDVDTLNVINNWIDLVKGEGWLKERKTYWFGTMDWKILTQ